jgi:tetratricopeptide (TPR) repeat protein
MKIENILLNQMQGTFMRNKIHCFIPMIFLLVILTSTNLSAQITQWEKQLKTDPVNTEFLLKLGTAYHDLAGENEDKAAVKKAEGYLSKLLAIEPDNAPAMVYYGSVLTMKAREAFFPWDKMKYMKQGFAKMDSAVVLGPDEPEVRLIRGINSTSVPKMFNRLKVALSDFLYIEGLEKEKLNEMTNKFWLPYYFYFGLALEKDGQLEPAREKFAKVIELDSNSELANKARQQLEKMKNE